MSEVLMLPPSFVCVDHDISLSNQYQRFEEAAREYLFDGEVVYINVIVVSNLLNTDNAVIQAYCLRKVDGKIVLAHIPDWQVDTGVYLMLYPGFSYPTYMGLKEYFETFKNTPANSLYPLWPDTLTPVPGEGEIVSFDGAGNIVTVPVSSYIPDGFLTPNGIDFSTPDTSFFPPDMAGARLIAVSVSGYKWQATGYNVYDGGWQGLQRDYIQPYHAGLGAVMQSKTGKRQNAIAYVPDEVYGGMVLTSWIYVDANMSIDSAYPDIHSYYGRLWGGGDGVSPYIQPMYDLGGRGVRSIIRTREYYQATNTAYYSDGTQGNPQSIYIELPRASNYVMRIEFIRYHFLQPGRLQNLRDLLLSQIPIYEEPVSVGGMPLTMVSIPVIMGLTLSVLSSIMPSIRYNVRDSL